MNELKNVCKYCSKEFKSERALNAHRGLVHKEILQEDKLNSFVVVGNDTLDITYRELERLRKAHMNRHYRRVAQWYRVFA